jgi:hypothetical protein
MGMHARRGDIEPKRREASWIAVIRSVALARWQKPAPWQSGKGSGGVNLCQHTTNAARFHHPTTVVAGNSR